MSTLPQGDPGWDANGSPATSASIAVGILASIMPVCACGCGRLLSGRQRKFASKDCASRIYEASRPRILNASAGAPREGTIKQAVMDFLGLNPGWHSAHEIAAAIKADKHSVVTRISELRGAFIPIEEDLPVGNSRRSHRYRLVLRG